MVQRPDRVAAKWNEGLKKQMMVPARPGKLNSEAKPAAGRRRNDEEKEVMPERSSGTARSGQRVGEPMTKFRLLRVFNDEAVRGYANAKARIGRNALPYFEGDSLQDRIVRALVAERALPVKEVTEAFEFFAVTRRYLERTPVVVDLCSGHGLAGILFAAFSRHTEEILLCDRRRPQNFEPVLRACIQAAPWVEEKVRFIEGDLGETRRDLPKGSAVLGVHACGTMTDTCIEIALDLGGPLAVMPCCRANALSPAPAGLRHALGEDVAYDVDRTYTMERAGHRVRWRDIPEAITPMHRVLIAVPGPPGAPCTMDSREPT